MMLRALVVDEDPVCLDGVVRALTGRSIECQTAVSGIEAMERLQSEPFHFMLTELRLPGKHGHAVIVDALKLPSPPMIVAFTSITDPRIALDLFRRGVAHIEYKPLSYEVFAAKVSALFETWARRADPASEDTGNKIERVTAGLKQQLAALTESFQETINQLEAERREIENTGFESIRVLTALTGQLTQRPASHASRVESLCEFIARSMGVEPKSIRDLRIAALLHEIGQFGMTDTIHMMPPWRLPKEERELYEKYPTIGATLMSEIASAESIARLIETHAENFDGTGFPKGLSGTDIPLGARILRIADAFDTRMMHESMEAEPFAPEKFLALERGRAFDPELCKPMLKAIEECYPKASAEETEFIPPHELQVGMILCEDIYDDNGHFLCRSGAVVTSSLAKRLQALLGTREIAACKAPPNPEPAPPFDED